MKHSNLQLVTADPLVPAGTLEAFTLFDMDCEVLFSTYRHYQTRIDIFSKTAISNPHPLFDRDGLLEVTTPISVMLTKPNFSWIDMKRNEVSDVLGSLLEIGAFSVEGQPSKRLPPYGEVLQRVVFTHIGELLPARSRRH